MAPVDGFRAGRRSPIGVIAGLAACVLGAFRGAPLAAQTPAGTVIANRAHVTYTSANGGADSATSNTVILTVGRLGGDEFIVVQAELQEGDAAVAFAAELCAKLHEPIILDRPDCGSQARRC